MVNQIPQIRSAMYHGHVRHNRLGVPNHRFRYSISMPLLFLDEIEQICAMYRGWSSGKRGPVEYRESDFLSTRDLGGPQRDLTATVRDTVADRVGVRPEGPIAMLANLRGWGWQFNPIALYFCFDPTGSAVEHLVAEVTNTPWKQRHSYVVGAPGEHSLAKALHVSPFMTMDHEYRFRYSAPESELHVRMANVHRGSEVFVANLDLVRSEFGSREAARYVRSASAARVSLGIYGQALRLRMKGVGFVPHPNKSVDDLATSIIETKERSDATI